MKAADNKRVLWKLMWSLPLIIMLSSFIAFYVLPKQIASHVHQDAILSATRIIEQFNVIRGYYVENVILKVVEDGHLMPSVDHKEDDMAIPATATFMHDVGDLLSDKDIAIKFYSPYPFANRTERVLDQFQLEAWQALSENPSQTYARKVDIDGRTAIRVGIGDVMVRFSCIDCHNSHPESLKTDWNLNDLRGVLEARIYIDEQLERRQAVAYAIASALFALAVLLFICFFFFQRRV